MLRKPYSPVTFGSPSIQLVLTWKFFTVFCARIVDVHRQKTWVVVGRSLLAAHSYPLWWTGHVMGFVHVYEAPSHFVRLEVQLQIMLPFLPSNVSLITSPLLISFCLASVNQWSKFSNIVHSAFASSTETFVADCVASGLCICSFL